MIAGLAQERQRLIGAALARVFLGIAGLDYYVSGYGYRWFLWGPKSAFPLEPDAFGLSAALRQGLLPSFSLYSFSSAEAWFDIVFHCGIAVAALFVVFGGRALTVGHWLFLTSLYERNPLLLDGGDKLARILVLFLVLAETNAYLSPHAARRRSALRSTPTPTLSVLSHNAGLMLCVFQTAVVYLCSGLSKLFGQRWLDGTAVYYVTRIEQLHFLPELDWMTAQPLLGALVTYGVMATQLFYPLLLLVPHGRGLAAGLAVCMHIAISLKMGLIGFSLVMIGANALVVSDSDYRFEDKKFKRYIRVFTLGSQRLKTPSSHRRGRRQRKRE